MEHVPAASNVMSKPLTVQTPVVVEARVTEARSAAASTVNGVWPGACDSRAWRT